MLVEAIGSRNLQTVTELLSEANKEDKQAILGMGDALDEGISLFSYSVKLGNVEIAKALIDAGIQSDAGVFVENTNGQDTNSYATSKDMKGFVAETEVFDTDEDGRVINAESLQEIHEDLEEVTEGMMRDDLIFMSSDRDAALAIQESAELQTALQSMAENIERCPMSVLQFLMKTVPEHHQVKVPNKKLAASIDKLKKVMEQIAKDIKAFFTKGNGKVFLESFASFIKSVKAFFMETIPGITSEIWGKVAEKIIIPLQEKVKLVASHVQEAMASKSKGDVKKVYDQYRDQIKDEAVRKKIEAISRGAVNSREGRKKLSETSRKEGLKITLHNEEENKLKEREEYLGESIKTFTIMRWDSLSASDIEDLNEIGIEVAKGAKTLSPQQIGLLAKKLEEFDNEHTKIVQVLDDAKEISKLLEKRGVVDKAKKIIEKRYKSNDRSI